MPTPAEDTSSSEKEVAQDGKQDHHLFESLLPFRILAHATMALLYVPIVVAYIVIEYTYTHTLQCLISLLAFVILGILGLIDYWAYYRKFNTIFFAVVDVLLVLALPLCLWNIAINGFRFATDFDSFNHGDDAVDIEFGILTLVPVILSLLYLVIAGVVAFGHKKWGFQSLHYTPAAVAEEHKAVMKRHCSYFLFHHSYFRKHSYVVWCLSWFCISGMLTPALSFEPAKLAIFRGSMAVLACVGLLVFSIYSGFNQQEQHTNGNRSISESSIESYIASNDGRVSKAIGDYPTLSVTASTLDLSPMPTDFSVQQTWAGEPVLQLQMNTDTTISVPNQVWYCPPSTVGCNICDPSASGLCVYYPFDPITTSTVGTGFNASWSGAADMLIWPTVSQGIAWINSTQVQYIQPMVLSANTQYNVLLTIVGYERDNINWLFFDSQIISAVAATSSSASFKFSPFQEVVVLQTLSSQSIFVLIGNILSSIGGIFSFIDGVYAVIFGRTLLAIVMGSRPISPFGLIGIIARLNFQNLINAQFPKLIEDINASPKGMAAYVNEVAIDTGYIRSDRESKEAEAGGTTSENKTSEGSHA